MNWNEITKDETIAYKEYLFKTYKTHTVNLYIIAINGFFRFLNSDELCVKTIHVQKQFSVDILTFDDYAKLLAVAKEHDKDDIYHIMVTICCTGIRISELKFFTVDSIKKETFSFYSKRKSRNILIAPELRLLLCNYCDKHGIQSGFVFFGRNRSNVISEVTVLRKMKRLAEQAGVDKDKVFPHNLRHLFAKKFIEERGDLLDLADILGHTALATNRIYTMTSLDEKLVKMQNIGVKFIHIGTKI